MASPSKVLVLNLHSLGTHADVQAAITAALAAEPASLAVKDIERGLMKFRGQDVDTLMIALSPEGAGQVAETRSVVASGNILLTDGVILADSSTGAVAMALPLAGDAPNKIFTVKNIDDTNGVTIVPDAAEQIDRGGAGVAVDVTNLYDSISVISDGVEWWII